MELGSRIAGAVLLIVPFILLLLVLSMNIDVNTGQLNGNVSVNMPREMFCSISNSTLRVTLSDPMNQSTSCNIPQPLRTIVEHIIQPIHVIVDNQMLLVRGIVSIANSTLSVNILNQPLRTIIESLPQPLRVYVESVPLPVTIANMIDARIVQPVNAYVLNSTLRVRTDNVIDARIVNTPLPVTITTSTERRWYVVSSGASTLATNKVHLLLWNGGTQPVYVTRIMFASEVSAAVAGFHIGYRVNRVTSYSGGTTVAIVPLDTLYAAPAGVTALTNPTVGGAVTLFSVTVNQEEAGGNVFQDIILSDSPIVLRPGQGLAITQYPTATGTGSINVAIFFYTTG